MAFPLTGTPRSGTVSRGYVRGPVIKAVPTFTWNHYRHNQSGEETIFPATNRSVGVRFLTHASRRFLASVITRQWNGIGGVGYLPSFPQLDQHNTTWPHAS